MASESFQRGWIQGSADLLVLSVLADEPQYGYAIQKRIDEASAGRVRLTAGTLYPLLHRLESERLIRSRWEETTGRPRKWYELTARGRTRLEQQARDWRQFAACVTRLLAPRAQTPRTEPA